MNIKQLFEEVLGVEYTHLEKDASFAYKKDGDTLYVYFEHSNGKTDWKHNFNFPAKPYREMKNKWFAHRGFLKVWKIIEPHLQDKIFDLDIKYIIIGGYSHGAAIALLCHEYCKFNRPDAKISGYGYGCPRVVWGFLGKTVKQRFEGFAVIRNRRDIVTHLPPTLFGFRHVGEMKTIGKTNPIKDHYSERYLIELGENEKWM